MQENIIVKGARANNLKNIDVTIPRDKLVVMTGVSGSGKSSLAFDTIYAEGQRRYVESLSSYARMFLGQMDKPDVDYIEGLSPAISIDQKTTSKNPRSTVGTVTEIYDYLRLLWARAGTPHCPNCGKEIRQQTIDQIIDQVLSLPEGTRIQVMAPVIRGKKGEHAKVFEDAKRSGYVRVRVDGNLYELDEEIKLEKNKKHSIEIIVDRLIIRPDIRQRLTDSVETAAKLSGGLVIVNLLREEKDLSFSQNYACEDCGISMEELTPRMFSFNNPFGACPTCTGLGNQLKADPALIVQDGEKSILDGAIQASGWNNIRGDGISRMYFDALSKKYKFSLTEPWNSLSNEAKNIILYGTKGETLELHYDQPRGKGVLKQAFEGICNNIERRYKETQSDASRKELEELMSECPCPDCQGRRLRKESLAVTVGEKNIYEFTTLSVEDALTWMDGLTLTEQQMLIADRILKEIRSRLGFLKSVGLGYLTLARSAGTLSGGESQRIRLATQIGSSLMGVLYILDEPSIGLHPSNIVGLNGVMHDLIADGNSVVLVDHDTQVLAESNWLIEMGPEAGAGGGHVIAEGTVADLAGNPASQIGPFLGGQGSAAPRNRPAAELFAEGRIHLSTDAIHTVKPLKVDIPKGRLTVVTGVSGSGKTTLILESLVPALAAQTAGKPLPPHVRAVEADGIAQVKLIDATPIGINVRSTVATYANVHDELRKVFARTPDAKRLGYKAGDFSYNTGKLRCPVCDGTGVISLDVQFLPDVEIPCTGCRGSRYSRDADAVRHENRHGGTCTLPQLMDMDINTALTVCTDLKLVTQRLKVLQDLGLGYLTLGEETPSLSGGEAQRLKLASEMGRAQHDTVFVFDEPTIGLHPLDVRTLLGVFRTLIENGATVIVIEHDLDVIRSADYLIDMGPGGGEEGGRVVACGTPAEVKRNPESRTGKFI